LRKKPPNPPKAWTARTATSCLRGGSRAGNRLLPSQRFLQSEFTTRPTRVKSNSRNEIELAAAVTLASNEKPSPSLQAFLVGDSVAVMRFATGAGDDGATESRSGAVFLFISSRVIPYYNAWHRIAHSSKDPPPYKPWTGRGGFIRFYHDLIQGVGERPSSEHWLTGIDTSQRFMPGNLVLADTTSGQAKKASPSPQMVIEVNTPPCVPFTKATTCPRTWCRVNLKGAHS